MAITSPHLSDRTLALLVGSGTYVDGSWREPRGDLLDIVDP